MNIDATLEKIGFKQGKTISGNCHNLVIFGTYRGKKAILKQYEKPINQQREKVGIQKLQDESIPVPQIYFIGDELQITIFEYIKGRVCSTDSELQIMGEISKKIHRIPINTDRFDSKYFDRLSGHFSRKYIVNEYDANLIQEWRDRVGLGGLGYTTSDLRCRHFLFSEDRLAATIDLEYWDCLDTVWDLGIFVGDLETQTSNQREKLNNFFQGYVPSRRDLDLLPFYYGLSQLVQAKNKLTGAKSDCAIEKAREALKNRRILNTIWQ